MTRQSPVRISGKKILLVSQCKVVHVHLIKSQFVNLFHAIMSSK